MGRNKYGNHMSYADGKRYPSKRERNRHDVLKSMADNGVIWNLREQVKYTLIPEQREPDTVGPKGGIRRGHLIEKPCVYIADFVYEDPAGVHVEDVKGFRTEVYKIKRKLMLYVHGIRVEEV